MTQLTSDDEGADIHDDEDMDCEGVDVQCEDQADRACEEVDLAEGDIPMEMVNHAA
jgi:hypothetical protein